MSKQHFMSERQVRWERLEKVLVVLESRGIKKAQQHELDEFVFLYRITCSDLARARSEQLGDDIEAYLNSLVARGHTQFRPPSSPDLKKIGTFFLSDFPAAVRKLKWYVLAATLLFVLPTVLAAFLVANSPSYAFELTDPEQLEMLTDAYAEGHIGGRSEDDDSQMMGFYIKNNIGIAFRCFATGIFFGLGSMFFLVINGIMGGAVGAYICVSGYADSFLSFVIGHGAFELTAIVLSGAAGLRMGMLMVNPAPWTRLGAFKVHGQEILVTVLGCAAMLFIAAILEGFWSPSGAPSLIKFIVGGFLWCLVIVYLSLSGRKQNETIPSQKPIINEGGYR